MSETRIPQIVQKELEGKNQIQIADELGVSRMTTYRDRKAPLYKDIWEEVTHQLVKPYVNNVLELMRSATPTEKQEGTKEAGRWLRSGVTRQTKHTEDITVRATIDITEKRKRSDELIKTLELTPDQFNKWTQTAKSESENLEK